MALGFLMALLAGAALVPQGERWLVVREIDFTFEAQDAGADWWLRWRGADDTRAGEHRLELSEWSRAGARGRLSMAEPVWVFRRLPAADVESLALGWRDSAGAVVLVRNLVLTTRILGAVAHRERPYSGDLVARGAWYAAEDQFGITEASGAIEIPAHARTVGDRLIVWACMSGLVLAGLAVVSGVWIAAGRLGGGRGAGTMRGVERARLLAKFIFRTIPGVLVLTFLAALATLPLAFPVFVTRHVELVLDVHGVGPAWELEWVPEDDGRARNGFWIDLKAYGVPEAAGRYSTAQPLLVRRELPSYAIRELGLKWHESEGGSYAVERLSVVTKVLGRAVRSETLASGGVLTPTQPPSARAGFEAVGVARVMWLCALGIAWAAWVGVYLCAWGALKLPGLWDRLLAALPAPRGLGPRGLRVLKVAAWGAAIGAPVWLASWAPMILLSDSTAYIWLGKLLWENRDINHLDGWRLPGYALFIAPWIVHTQHYTLWIGATQALLGVGSAVLAFDMLRRRLAGAWPYVGMMLVALDPMLLVWQRMVLSEYPSGFLILLAAWAFVVIEPRLGNGRASSPPPRGLGASSFGGGVVAVACFAALGVLCGVAAVVRGNLQVLPLVIATGAAASGVINGRAWRGVLAGAALLALCVLTMSPILGHNARVFGRASLVVGTNTGRTIFAWLNTDVDFNQTRLFTFEEFRDLSGRVDRGEINEWQFAAEMQGNTRIAAPTGTHPWVLRDIRCTELLRECMSRMPARYAKRLIKAGASQLGFWVDYPSYFKRVAAGQVSVLRGSPVAEPTNFYDDLNRFPESIRPTLARVVHDASDVHKSPNARALGAWWSVWREARPVLMLLLGLGALRALLRRDVATVVMALFVFGNAAAVVVMQFSGEDRYGMPFFGVAHVAMLLGLFGGVTQRKPTT